MTVEVSPAWITAGCTVVTLVGGGLIAWIRSEITAVRATQKVLFEKYDAVCDDLQAYKLRVAETYVNQAALEKLLNPLERRLENIEKELREEHKR